MENKKLLKSGEFLVEEVEAQDVFIPEEFNEEQQMIAQTCQDFMDAEVFPNLDEIDKAQPGYIDGILKKAGELGLLGIAIPEQYNGFGQSFVTQMLASEKIGAGYSFAVGYSAHCGIGTLPIMYYGNEDQIQKYVTKLATGELLGAYCLTEPGAGSDANSGKTQAKLSEDGKHYILNGQKMWITNGGFADIQTVFAKIDNDRCLSAFIVEKNMEGVVINPPEKKMGIKGSITCQIFYNDVKVPVENLLGKRGEGFRIALSILHMGRIKLAGNVLGAMKKAISDSVRYANERKQFNQFISSFGSIKQKLAEQVIKTFISESATFRVSADIDNAIHKKLDEGINYGPAAIEGIAHYAVEAAILKVFASEALDYVVDEGVQIHGGMGYSAEMDIDKGYRDSRINRIFEGTNEINRLLVVDTPMKRAMKGDYDLFGKAKEMAANLDKIKPVTATGNYYEDIKAYTKNFKNVVLLLLNAAVEKFERKVAYEQEILNNIANVIMEVYVSESTALRVEKLEGIKGENGIKIYRDILDINVYDAAAKIMKNAADAIYSITEGTDAEKLINAIKALTTVKGINVKEARRRIADKLIEDNQYKF